GSPVRRLADRQSGSDTRANTCTAGAYQPLRIGPSLCPRPKIPDAGASQRLTYTFAGRPAPSQWLAHAAARRTSSLISPEAETPAGASARPDCPMRFWPSCLIIHELLVRVVG